MLELMSVNADSIYFFPFFQGGIWDLIVFVPDPYLVFFLGPDPFVVVVVSATLGSRV